MLFRSARAEDDELDIDVLLRRQIDAFRAHHPLGEQARATVGPVVIPIDSATADQLERYRAYAEARSARVGVPQGPARLLFARDLVGPSEQLAEELSAMASYAAVEEMVVALPFSFGVDDHTQILTDLAEVLGPLLGWTPGTA